MNGPIRILGIMTTASTRWRITITSPELFEAKLCGYPLINPIFNHLLVEESSGMAARIRVKNSRMCRTGGLQDLATPLRLWPRFVTIHPAHPTDIMGTGVFTKPLAPSPV